MDSMTVKLPKIAPTVYRRTAVQSWLQFHADVPLRLVSAPAGSGKTTVAVMYARTRPSIVGYVSIAPHTTRLDLFAGIGSAADLATSDDYQGLLERLSTLPRVEIIVDDLDNASLPVREALQHIYRDVADTVTFIYLMRSAEAMSVGDGMAKGLVATCDPGLLRFRAAEIASYAQGLGLNEDPLSIARLQVGTHGWATAIAGVCREAAGTSKRLHEAWPRWLHLARQSILEMVADTLRNVPPDVRDVFRQVVSGQISDDQQSLRRFGRYGLFVDEEEGRLTLNPLVALDGSAEPNDPAELAGGRATLEMFGRFEFRVDGKPIVWRRRRDRQIVGYLAMQPDGRATRAQLIAAFWPDADRQLAAQSLRTACCTIRRAVGACVGSTNIGRYFVAGQVVELKLDVVESSVIGFTSQMANADRAYDAGEARAAYLYYAAARRFCVAPFLVGEPPTDWSAPHIVRLAAMNLRCSDRLTVLADCARNDDSLGDLTSVQRTCIA